MTSPESPDPESPDSHSPANTRTCPRCGQDLPAPKTENGLLTDRWPHFPFCSKRCGLIDFNGWMTDAYVIPGSPADPDPTSR